MSRGTDEWWSSDSVASSFSSSDEEESIKHRKRDKKDKKNKRVDSDADGKKKRAADIDLAHLYAVAAGDVRKRGRFDGENNTGGEATDYDIVTEDEENDSSYNSNASSSFDSEEHSTSGDSSDDTVDREARRILQEPDPDISSYESSSTSQSSDDASESNIDVTDYDVCKARYQLLFDKEQRYTVLSPETRERYRAQLALSVWAPINEASFDLEGKDRKQVFKDYARAALQELLPHSVEPSKSSTKELVKILKF